MARIPPIPALVSGIYTARDARTVSVVDQHQALALLLNEAVYTYPQEASLWYRPWENKIIWAMDARGAQVRADYEARQQYRITLSTVLGNFDPVLFAIYDNGALNNSFLWYGIELLPRQGNVRPYRAWPMSGGAAFETLANKATFFFNVLEAFFGFNIPDGEGANFRLTQAAVWHYRDATRNSVGDQWMQAVTTEFNRRRTRQNAPLQATSVNNDGGLTGRTLYIISPS